MWLFKFGSADPPTPVSIVRQISIWNSSSLSCQLSLSSNNIVLSVLSLWLKLENVDPVSNNRRCPSAGSELWYLHSLISIERQTFVGTLAVLQPVAPPQSDQGECRVFGGCHEIESIQDQGGATVGARTLLEDCDRRHGGGGRHEDQRNSCHVEELGERLLLGVGLYSS